MKIGMLGLGKLGLPVAVAMGYKGHEVIGYDIDRNIADYLYDASTYPYIESGYDDLSFPDLLSKYTPQLVSDIADLAKADIIFCAIQTPHQSKYDGTHPLPADRQDFNYNYLKAAIAGIAPYLDDRHILVVISTCLPGTIRREILPIMQRGRLIYNPFFIAMGTVVLDFLNPEFVLIGGESPELKQFYSSIYSDRTQLLSMSYESAELTKVAYNTFIGFKIGLANTYGQLCECIDHADIDHVTDALKLANDRLISEKYLTAGMGDGGACHPRDNIAMAWLAEQHLACNPFDDMMQWREQHARHLADSLLSLSAELQLEPAIFGLAFKPNTSMLDGSHAMLVARLVVDAGVFLYDPMIDRYACKETQDHLGGPRCILIGCKHDVFATMAFPRGSVIIDPHRYIPDQECVTVIRLGEGK